MQFEEFIDQVQQRAQLDSRQDAETLTAITLATLAEPLSRDATNLLASQLPKELKDLLSTHKAEPLEGMQQYTLEEFYNRIKARLNLTFNQGIDVAHAVTGVLPQAVSADVIERIQADLPEAYRQLFS